MSAISERDKAEAHDNLRHHSVNSRVRENDRQYFRLEDMPESISRADYQALARSLGFDLKNLKALEFQMDGVYAIVMARRSNGHHIVDSTINEIVTHKVFIPAVDEPVDES